MLRLGAPLVCGCCPSVRDAFHFEGVKLRGYRATANAARLERIWLALERTADIAEKLENNETRPADTLTGTTADRAGADSTVTPNRQEDINS